MGTNANAPTGLVYSRNLNGASPTYQNEFRFIKNGYGSKIGIGDLVSTLTGANQGYVGLALAADTAILGVFVGITGTSSSPGMAGATGDGYYDVNTQTYSYGLNGAYLSTMAPAAGVDIGARIVSDPMAIFRAQMIGGSFTNSLIGQNINFAANGAPNASGISTAYLDFATVGVGGNLPFRILGVSGFAGGPMDPTNVNPWIEVKLNTPENATPGGI